MSIMGSMVETTWEVLTDNASDLPPASAREYRWLQGLHRGTEVLSDDVLHLRNPRAVNTEWDHLRHPAYPQSVQQYPFIWRFGYPCCGVPPTEPSTNVIVVRDMPCVQGLGLVPPDHRKPSRIMEDTMNTNPNRVSPYPVRGSVAPT